MSNHTQQNSCDTIEAEQRFERKIINPIQKSVPGNKSLVQLNNAYHHGDIKRFREEGDPQNVKNVKSLGDL